jgi:hypothetical protein
MSDPQLFIVRVWHRADRLRAGARGVAPERVPQFDSRAAVTQFRASVRRVGDEAVHVFSSAQSVGEFLSRPIAATPQSEPSAIALNLSEDESK